jgi:hypothetical protein
MLQQRFAALTTAHLADACIRAQPTYATYAKWPQNEGIVVAPQMEMEEAVWISNSSKRKRNRI